jgi:soluble lytic murein transglycosylase
MLLLSFTLQGNPSQDYLQRFMAYSRWYESIPDKPNDEFLAFIDSGTPLSNKLREKWLYLLAQKKDWPTFSKYYKPSNDFNLQCFAHRAEFYQGNTQQALKAATSLWLTGSSLPVACDGLFKLLLKSDHFDEKLISQRISLALENQNTLLAFYLLGQYKKPRRQEQQLLQTIAQNPSRVALIGPGEFHSQFYLYGLKRLVSINMDKALKLWSQPKTYKLLTQAQQQSFLAQVALYKAMRNQQDTKFWFSKIKPEFYNEVLLDWQIRYALRQEQWQRVQYLINRSKDKDNPCWQYWLARAKEANGNQEAARQIYQSLAKTRNYYGFLSSLRLKKKPSFQNENISHQASLLRPYRPITDNVKSLYQSNQPVQASRLLNDFMLELPKNEKSALIYWIANTLQWHGKSVHLSNNPELANELSLRFPLAYANDINAYSKNYLVPREFIYAIIRQESGFRLEVVSPAGARGLMQVMPTTASVIAKQEKIPYQDKVQLFTSQKNINLGVAYLRHLGKRFNRHPLLIAAAYNAGPRQVVNWVKNQPTQPIDIWIETLPWRETRNYLKNIIAFYTVYQYRLNQKPDLSDFMKPLKG